MLMITSVCEDEQVLQQRDQQDYSYYFARRAFAPLLQRWGDAINVTRPESRLDFALWRARQRGLNPIHFSLEPLRSVYVTRRAPNVAFVLWGFPDIPGEDIGGNPRNNWTRIANRHELILTASTFTRDAFVRAGIQRPVRVIPGPVRPDYFAVPVWQVNQEVVLECPVYMFPQHDPSISSTEMLANSNGPRLEKRAKHFYGRFIKPRLPRRVTRHFTRAMDIAALLRQADGEDEKVNYKCGFPVRLSGVIYTSIVNPFDPTSNWQDLLSASLLALGNREDVTVVVKLVVCPASAAKGLNRVIHYYKSMGLRHRCKLAFITEDLSDRRLLELARASTYYLNTSRAEGAYLPLQEFLAAGRPCVGPKHSALSDYFSSELGFLVDSHPEPAFWPCDSGQLFATKWHRLVWQSLHDQIKASYELTRNLQHYQTLASNARERMLSFASVERVWPLLRTALDSVFASGSEGSI